MAKKKKVAVVNKAAVGVRKAEPKKKIVFKNALGNPFSFEWKKMDFAKEDVLLKDLIKFVKPYARPDGTNKLQRKLDEEKGITKKRATNPPFIIGVNQASRLLQRQNQVLNKNPQIDSQKKVAGLVTVLSGPSKNLSNHLLSQSWSGGISKRSLAVKHENSLKLAAALNIPHFSVISILDVPESQGILKRIEESAPKLNLSWIPSTAPPSPQDPQPPAVVIHTKIERPLLKQNKK